MEGAEFEAEVGVDIEFESEGEEAEVEAEIMTIIPARSFDMETAYREACARIDRLVGHAANELTLKVE
jgi:hypothetical protein